MESVSVVVFWEGNPNPRKHYQKTIWRNVMRRVQTNTRQTSKENNDMRRKENWLISEVLTVKKKTTMRHRSGLPDRLPDFSFVSRNSNIMWTNEPRRKRNEKYLNNFICDNWFGVDLDDDDDTDSRWRSAIEVSLLRKNYLMSKFLKRRIFRECCLISSLRHFNDYKRHDTAWKGRTTNEEGKKKPQTAHSTSKLNFICVSFLWCFFCCLSLFCHILLPSASIVITAL